MTTDTDEWTALQAALNDLQERGRALASRRDASPLRQARRIRALGQDTVTLVVLDQRRQGASWAQIADDLDEAVEFVRAHYGPIERDWQVTGDIHARLHMMKGQPRNAG